MWAGYRSTDHAHGHNGERRDQRRGPRCARCVHSFLGHSQSPIYPSTTDQRANTDRLRAANGGESNWDQRQIIFTSVPSATCLALDSERLERGVVVESGCEGDGQPGALCRLGCSEGFEISNAADGRCTLNESGTTAPEGTELIPADNGGALLCLAARAAAVYEGQAATCRPETNLDGTMAESYCRLEESEAIRSCCDLGGAPAGTCGTNRPPETCHLECVELWLPLVEICGLYLAAYQVRHTCSFHAKCPM
jgi:hypothetical protein